MVFYAHSINHDSLLSDESEETVYILQNVNFHLNEEEKMKKRGGNTNLYRTYIKPKGIKKKKRITNSTRGGGIFSFLAKGLKKAKNKIPSSLVNVAKRAVKKGTAIAKQQLRDPEVQKAIQSAVVHGTQLATNHLIQKVSPRTTATNKVVKKSRELKSKKKKKQQRKLFE